MKISVITVVFNRASTIAEAMVSVQQQSYADVEHVVQDGGSTDGTLEQIARLANAETSLVTERDAGIYDAINRGIARSSGDIVGLMHSDDTFAHDHVLDTVAGVMRDPNVDGVYGDLQYVSARDPIRVIRHWQSKEYHPLLLKRGWMPPHPTVYLRKEVFERFGSYDTSFSIAADYDAMLRYLVKGQISLTYIPDVLVKMRLGGESNRSFERVLRKSQEDLRALRKNGVGGFGALAAKNVSKLGQFFAKDRKIR